jgi:hypothetical protein
LANLEIDEFGSTVAIMQGQRLNGNILPPFEDRNERARVCYDNGGSKVKDSLLVDIKKAAYLSAKGKIVHQSRSRRIDESSE